MGMNLALIPCKEWILASSISQSERIWLERNFEEEEVRTTSFHVHRTKAQARMVSQLLSSEVLGSLSKKTLWLLSITSVRCVTWSNPTTQHS